METRQPGLWAAFLSTYIASLIAVILRLVARRLKEVRLSADDYSSLIAFVFTTGFTAVNLYKIHMGLGLRLKDVGLPYDRVAHDYFQLLWIDSWFYTLSIGLSKFAALLLYTRIFGHSSIKRPIQALQGLVMAWIMARLIVIPLQCIPIQRYWNHNVQGTCPVKPNLFFFVTTILHLLMEIAIVILPISKVIELNLPLSQKIAVGGMFASGTIVWVASLFQLIAAFRLDVASQDLWWTGAPQIMCAVTEVNLGHFSTSLPNLRPIFTFIHGRFPARNSPPTPVYEENAESSAKPCHVRSSLQTDSTYYRVVEYGRFARQ